MSLDLDALTDRDRIVASLTFTATAEAIGDSLDDARAESTRAALMLRYLGAELQRDMLIAVDVGGHPLPLVANPADVRRHLARLERIAAGGRGRH